MFVRRLAAAGGGGASMLCRGINKNLYGRLFSFTSLFTLHNSCISCTSVVTSPKECVRALLRHFRRIISLTASLGSFPFSMRPPKHDVFRFVFVVLFGTQPWAKGRKECPTYVDLLPLWLIAWYPANNAAAMKLYCVKS